MLLIVVVHDLRYSGLYNEKRFPRVIIDQLTLLKTSSRQNPPFSETELNSTSYFSRTIDPENLYIYDYLSNSDNYMVFLHMREEQVERIVDVQIFVCTYVVQILSQKCTPSLLTFCYYRGY